MYLTNVEALARKFVDEKREALARLRNDAGGFRAFWAAVDARTRRQLATATGDAVLKARQSAPDRVGTVAVGAELTAPPVMCWRGRTHAPAAGHSVLMALESV